MTVESNYVIAIATLSDWLKSRASFSSNEKQKQNQSYHVRVIFPALRASYRWLLGIVIGSSRCSSRFLLWLVGVIALVLVFRQSFENCSMFKLHVSYYEFLGVLWKFFVVRLVIPRHNSVDHTKLNSLNIVFFYLVTEHKHSFFSVGFGGNLPRGS